MPAIYRIVRTVMRGPFASDECFRQWTATLPNVTVVAGAEDPGNDGGPNDHRWYLWKHDGPVDHDTSKCDWGLFTDAGRSGWESQAEAVKVLEKYVGQSAKISDMVDAANKAAVDPAKIAVDAAKDAAKDAGKAVNAVATATPWWVKVGLGAGVVAAIGYAIRSVWRK